MNPQVRRVINRASKTLTKAYAEVQKDLLGLSDKMLWQVREELEHGDPNGTSWLVHRIRKDMVVDCATEQRRRATFEPTVIQPSAKQAVDKSKVL